MGTHTLFVTKQNTYTYIHVYRKSNYNANHHMSTIFYKLVNLLSKFQTKNFKLLPFQSIEIFNNS